MKLNLINTCNDSAVTMLIILPLTSNLISDVIVTLPKHTPGTVVSKLLVTINVSKTDKPCSNPQVSVEIPLLFKSRYVSVSAKKVRCSSSGSAVPESWM